MLYGSLGKKSTKPHYQINTTNRFNGNIYIWKTKNLMQKKEEFQCINLTKQNKNDLLRQYYKRKHKEP